jgi:hypothetical protein
MLARHRSGGDEAMYKEIVKGIGKLSTGLLERLLNDEQLHKLREMEEQ